jgi:putative membrane protein
MFTGDQIIERATALKERFGLSTPDDDMQRFSKSLLKGMFAGMIGGLVGTAAKTLAEKVYPPRVHGEPEPPAKLAQKATGGQLDGGQTAVAAEAIHWGFGALTGAAYGGLAEFYPKATSKEGASFGLTLAALTHDSALPAMGLSADPKSRSQREQTSEMVTHVIFGVVTEIVRSLTRKMLG